MLDWLTLKTNAINLTESARRVLQMSQSTLIMIDPDGAVKWERPSRATVRSDSHQVTVEFGSDLVIYGSPARVALDRQDNVFGSDDVIDCAGRMLAFVSGALGIELPVMTAWACTRMDVTENYNLGDLTTVKQALELLRHAQGGRYQVRTCAESVYWSPASTYRSGKIYAKGAHMDFLRRKGECFLSDEEFQLVQGILRLELSLRRHFFKRCCEKKWYELTATDLAAEHEKYFSKLVGSVEITELSDMQARLIEAAKSLDMSPGYGKSAFGSWQWIRASGFSDWRDGMARSTFYKHLKILQAAGLSYADFQGRKVVPIRRRRIVLDQPVKSWAELRRAA
jgi:II/X family phage/plasmid replication protein